MDECRKEFERVHLGNNKKIAARNEHGDYVCPYIESAWAGWKSLWNTRTTQASGQQSEPVLLDKYAQTVPSKCDRIIWRGKFYNLPITPAANAAQDVRNPTKGEWMCGGNTISSKDEMLLIFKQSVDAHVGELGEYFIEIYNADGLRIAFLAGPTAYENAKHICKLHNALKTAAPKENNNG